MLPPILPQVGLLLLAGKPKIGKSWLALDLALGVAENAPVMTSIMPGCTGDVLYLALEDNRRRLQNRITKLRGAYARKWPAGLTMLTEWRRLHEGGRQDLEEWIVGANNPRLIVVDTLQRVRKPPAGKGNGYGEDYEALQELHGVANAHDIAIGVVHHVRKTVAEDPLDTVSGTLGLNACADTIFVLDSTPKGKKLYGRGREVEEVDLAVEFDKPTCLWRVLGEAAEVQRSDARKAILKALEAANGEPRSPKEIAEATGATQPAVKQLLLKMAEEGEVLRPTYGKYARLPK